MKKSVDTEKSRDEISHSAVEIVETVDTVYTIEGLGALTGLMWLLHIYCHMVRTPLGIGYMALWGFGAKCLTGWVMEWMGDG